MSVALDPFRAQGVVDQAHDRASAGERSSQLPALPAQCPSVLAGRVPQHGVLGSSSGLSDALTWPWGCYRCDTTR